MANEHTWRTTAIVFIVLFILETAAIVWMVNAGISAMDNEQECMDACWEMPEAGYYTYDGYAETCYCLNENNEIISKIKLM